MYFLIGLVAFAWELILRGKIFFAMFFVESIYHDLHEPFISSHKFFFVAPG